MACPSAIRRPQISSEVVQALTGTGYMGILAMGIHGVGKELEDVEGRC